MEFSITILALIAIITVTGLIWTLTQSQSVDAWHSQGWASEADCVNYDKQVTGNNETEAKYKCDKVISHDLNESFPSSILSSK
jgi:hypothetical protein